MAKINSFGRLPSDVELELELGVRASSMVKLGVEERLEEGRKTT
jgi:hypothetical protein